MIISRFNFKTKLILLLELFIIVASGYLGIFVWRELSYMTREMSREKLMTITATTAAFINSAEIDAIQSPDDKIILQYSNLLSILQKAMNANPEAYDIYLARKQKDNNWVLLLGGYETKDENNNGKIESEEEAIKIGEPLDTSDAPEIEKSLIQKAADKEINCDKWGCWLSGYAPIKNNDGETIAIIGADISAENILAFEKKIKLAIAIVMLPFIIIFPFILYFFLLFFLRPISQITKGLKKFSGNLKTRIRIKTNDEFRLIADTFNDMAMRLEELYGNLDAKVKQKTKELAEKVSEIEKEKAKDEALISSIGDGIIATNKQGKIILVNKPAEDLLNQKLSEIQGRKIDEVIQLEDENGEIIPKDESPFSVTLFSGKKISVSHFINSGKEKIPLAITSSPVTLKNKIIGSISVLHDITKEKEIDRAKSEFVSLASHQLRSPLSNINLYSQLLSDKTQGEMNEKQRHYLEKITTANKKMISLVSSLLNVARLELGTFIIDARKIDLSKILQGIIEEYSEKISEKEIKIIEKYDETIPEFSGDLELLQIVFENLISNALKYTPPKGTLTLELSTFQEKRKKMFLIKVIDTGCGIPEKDTGGIFTKLFRADNVKDMPEEGTGLGLYIVKSIIERSGGKITFESKENQGTTFSVIFPEDGMRETKIKS